MGQLWANCGPVGGGHEWELELGRNGIGKLDCQLAGFHVLSAWRMEFARRNYNSAHHDVRFVSFVPEGTLGQPEEGLGREPGGFSLGPLFGASVWAQKSTLPRVVPALRLVKRARSGFQRIPSLGSPTQQNRRTKVSLKLAMQFIKWDYAEPTPNTFVRALHCCSVSLVFFSVFSACSNGLCHGKKNKKDFCHGPRKTLVMHWR